MAVQVSTTTLGYGSQCSGVVRNTRVWVAVIRCRPQHSGMGRRVHVSLATLRYGLQCSGVDRNTWVWVAVFRCRPQHSGMGRSVQVSTAVSALTPFSRCPSSLIWSASFKLSLSLCSRTPAPEMSSVVTYYLQSLTLFSRTAATRLIEREREKDIITCHIHPLQSRAFCQAHSGQA